ncbi:cobalamin adenosyltransferase [Senegalia massiliensis]|uniref:Cobalamin adenosyltransferase n=1 Tax=Senegalia massiliensis TaxID=1720316 RepID=A0A845QTI9_9CLOT|nr:cobalamin adenosyltransferase [Senegalia massiliensis]NBI06147.1 cobalamin adenosyltransferase [Senegalia massiliensis]
MKVLTEAQLRAKHKKEQMENLIVKSNTIITPSAKEYLNEKNIKLVFEDKEHLETTNEEEKETKEEKFTPKYICQYTGGYLEEKPENMTQLYGNELVFKNHPSIIFRGKLDSLQSKILEIQVLAHKDKKTKLIDDLQEILEFVRNILKSEVINQKIEDFNFFGIEETDIREMSHNPKNNLGVDHILPDYKMGELVIGLNSIRSNIREVEIVSISLNRDDIIKSLNRLSSAVYVMMCRYLAGYYK